MVVGASTVVTLGGGVGGRWTLTGRALRSGDVLWAKSIPARRITRLFADGKGALFATMARDGRFQLERYRESDGEAFGAMDLDRRRAIVSGDGQRIWTRDAEGLTLHRWGAPSQSFEVLGNGPMTAHGEWLISTGAEVTAIRGETIAWRAPGASRDLTAVAAADGLDDDDEDDIWDADLGRAAIADEDVLVADRNGLLHAFDLRSGKRRWTAESEHYPSAEGVAIPAALDAHVFFPASDETLYLVDRSTGAGLAHVELSGPFAGAAHRLEDVVVLADDGLSAFAAG